ncbi:hypothetical protein ABGV42_01320 [Paenibacillus pabuli]|uniref:hypothetical protein n=1 Tax=Paenibacillus pabuli TaxID=1472 RepID=UPI00324262AC
MDKWSYIYVVAEGNCVGNDIATLDLDEAVRHYMGRTGTYFHFEIWENGICIKTFNSNRDTSDDIYDYFQLIKR